ncbi:MAG: DUF4442 domain-containing protein [Calditrichaceae bacterium]
MVNETFKTKIFRWGMNIFPAYRGTGARIIHISGDWTNVRIKIPLSMRTRNYVNTIFGGSMYGGVDPIYMLMLLKILGPDYIVWDKAATIRFMKPGRQTLYADFTLDKNEIDEIVSLLKFSSKTDRKYLVELKSSDGVTHAKIEKTIHISLKNKANEPVESKMFRAGESAR